MTPLQQSIDKLAQHSIKYITRTFKSDDSTEHLAELNYGNDRGASCLVFISENGPIAIIKRSDCKIDNKALKQATGNAKLKFAESEELRELTGFEVGQVNPLLLNIPIFIDYRVLEIDTVLIGSGEARNSAIELNPHDLQKVTKAKLIDVSLAPESDPDRKLRILSGITPSSSKGLHLGNYLGAVKSHIEFQEKGECFYFIADYHALNTVFDANIFRSNVYETYLDYLAMGIDTEKTVFYIESQIPAIFELTEILNNVVSVAEMMRMHAYKDKLDSDIDQKSINMGLFTYPILMAADILAFEPDIIPVGEDQAQHVEVCRDIAKAFNSRYPTLKLKVPDLYVKSEVARVPGTDGVRKMSKSLGNDLTIFASEEELRKQVFGITTDPGRIRATDPGDPDKNVIFRYLKLLEYPEVELADLIDSYRAGTIADTKIKELFYEFFLNYFAEMRSRRIELSANPDHIKKLMTEGGQRANKVAEAIKLRIRNALGVANF